MNVDLTAEALAYGREAARALEAAGGENLIQSSERTEALRDVKLAPVLADTRCRTGPRSGAAASQPPSR